MFSCFFRPKQIENYFDGKFTVSMYLLVTQRQNELFSIYLSTRFQWIICRALLIIIIIIVVCGEKWQRSFETLKALVDVFI